MGAEREVSELLNQMSSGLEDRNQLQFN